MTGNLPISQISAAENQELDLTDIRVLRELLRAQNMRPLKSFGQNFLIDRTVLEQIVAAAGIGEQEEILELGAGTGVLTRELAKRGKRVVAVEIERDMLTLLAQTTAEFTNVETVARNLLFINPVDLFEQRPYKLVANLPYYITAPTFRHFLESENRPQKLVVMVQWEVAQRIVAEAGDLSLLGVSVQFYGNARIITRVAARAFYPAPRVDSAILEIDVAPRAELSLGERNRFFRLVQAGFSERRKQLHNALTHSLHQKNELVRAWLSQAEIDASRRAETLTVEDWLRLWRLAEGARIED